MKSNPLTWGLGHKYNVCSILIHKDDEVQVDYDLLLRAVPQVQCALHPDPQGRRGAGRAHHLVLLSMTLLTEVCHKYNKRSIPIRKDDEV